MREVEGDMSEEWYRWISVGSTGRGGGGGGQCPCQSHAIINRSYAYKTCSQYSYTLNADAYHRVNV